MKQYFISVQDKQDNVLTTIEISAKNISDARKQMKNYKANCKINDAIYFSILFR